MKARFIWAALWLCVLGGESFADLPRLSCIQNDLAVPEGPFIKIDLVKSEKLHDALHTWHTANFSSVGAQGTGFLYTHEAKGPAGDKQVDVTFVDKEGKERGTLKGKPTPGGEGKRYHAVLVFDGVKNLLLCSGPPKITSIRVGPDGKRIDLTEVSETGMLANVTGSDPEADTTEKVEEAPRPEPAFVRCMFTQDNRPHTFVALQVDEKDRKALEEDYELRKKGRLPAAREVTVKYWENRQLYSGEKKKATVFFAKNEGYHFLDRIEMQLDFGGKFQSKLIVNNGVHGILIRTPLSSKPAPWVPVQLTSCEVGLNEDQLWLP